ncbi:hypothetical protein [uncultured Gelidibacter sp.]|uniref:hypothetical protein n=1 Tax=uncultured Gelidibacter sp. TaxID=259318 RepID=UPI002634C307|nr:hypothetical protein [uncultured Gelidibacter sp.]
MKNKIFASLTSIIVVGSIIWLIFFSDYFEIVVSSIFSILSFLFFLFIASLVSYYLFLMTKKWLTIGLDESEKDGAVTILAIIVYGSIIYALYYFMSLYSDEIESVSLALLRIIVGTFILYGILIAFFEKALKTIDLTIKKSLILLAVSLIICIIIDYLFGDIIISWLKSNWYYLVGGLVGIALISIIIDNKKKPTSN